MILRKSLAAWTVIVLIFVEMFSVQQILAVLMENVFLWVVEEIKIASNMRYVIEVNVLILVLWLIANQDIHVKRDNAIQFQIIAAKIIALRTQTVSSVFVSQFWLARLFYVNKDIDVKTINVSL